MLLLIEFLCQKFSRRYTVNGTGNENSIVNKRKDTMHAGASRAHARGSKPTDEIHARGSINRGWEEWLPSEAEVEGDSAGADSGGVNLW